MKPAQQPPSEDLSVSQLIVGFLEHAASYYDYKERSHFKAVCTLLRRRAGDMLAKSFGPKKLKEIREAMIEMGWARKSINRQCVRLRQIFSWGVSEELVPPTNLAGLQTVKGLRAGRSKAKELPPIRPVDQAVVEATLAELPETLASMVQIQLLSGCRPGELIAMRPVDIDRDGEVWFFRPEHHKTEHCGHSRAIAIGPRAQSLLLRYLARAPESFCFSPADSEAKRLAENTYNRKTPISCGNKSDKKNRWRDAKKKPGEFYTVDSYRRAIHRACKRAGVEQWSPHRLRHSAATLARAQFGLDAAQTMLGHRGAAITELYAELDEGKAAEVALKIGWMANYPKKY